MKKIILIAVAVVVLLLVGTYYGLLPGLSMTVNTATVNSNHSGIKGTGELIGPNNRKGFITSHIDDGFSQTITCIGRILTQSFSGTADMTRYRYRVYGRTLLGGWEEIGGSKYLSNPSPGEIKIDVGLPSAGTMINLNAYSFEIVGNHYKALRVTLEGFIDPNGGNYFDEGYKWRTL